MSVPSALLSHPTVCSDDLVVRPMTLLEAELASHVATSLGMNPGLYDFEALYEADPQGQLTGELYGDGIGYGSTVLYDELVAFTQGPFVRAGYETGGFSERVFQAILDHCGESAVVADRTSSDHVDFDRYGFRHYQTIARYQGLAIGSDHPRVSALAQVDFKKLVAYDAACSGVRRDQFLGSWISRPLTEARAYVEEDLLRGFAVVRPCQIGYKIGPFYADDETVALHIWNGLSARISGGRIAWDVPESNAAAIALAEKMGLRRSNAYERLSTGDVPSVDFGRVFGITSRGIG